MHEQSSNDEKALAQLLQAGGKRSMPSEDSTQRAYQAALAEWQDLPLQREPERQSSKPGWFALAAAVAVVGLVGLVTLAWLQPGSELHENQYAATLVHAPAEYTGPQAFAAGQSLNSNLHKLTVELRGGALITLDRHTQLRLDEPRILSVQKGRIYVDAFQLAEAIAVRTAHGVVTDIGTQFEVALHDDALVVAVREGAVSIDLQGRVVTALAEQGYGDMVTLKNGEVHTRQSLSTDAAHWQWRKTGRPALPLPGVTVFDYVTWMARDNGRLVMFRSDSVAQQARLQQLRASADTTSDDLDFDEVLASTGFVVADTGSYTWIMDYREHH